MLIYSELRPNHQRGNFSFFVTMSIDQTKMTDVSSLTEKFKKFGVLGAGLMRAPITRHDSGCAAGSRMICLRRSWLSQPFNSVVVIRRANFVSWCCDPVAAVDAVRSTLVQVHR